MDDQLEAPTALETKIPPPSSGHSAADEDDDSGEEDVPDWTRFAPAPTQAGPSSPSISLAPSLAGSSVTKGGKKQIIPQRGDKEFEPSQEGETRLQSFALGRARGAMFAALRAERGSSSKNITHGLWIPRLGRVAVPKPRGQYFNTMGHFVELPRSMLGVVSGNVRQAEDRDKKRKRTEKSGEEKTEKQVALLPEEALYLIERGSMFCWRPHPQPSGGDVGIQEVEDEWHHWAQLGYPMSVQQAWAEMIGSEHLTRERYQVYAYLRRLGYTVTRAHPPNSALGYAQPPPLAKPISGVWSRLWTGFCSWWARWASWGRTGRRDWWRPLQLGWGRRVTYSDVFRSLRFIPAGPSLPLSSKVHASLPVAGAGAHTTPTPATSAYEIFFHVWKPSTTWKKTSVPAPDFEVVVVDANNTRMPTLPEFSHLFAQLPIQPPPAPRKRPTPTPAPVQPPKPSSSPPTPPTFLTRLLQLLHLAPRSEPRKEERRIQPFVALKAGRKSVVVAVVDAGSVSFVRFGEGVFGEFPMV